MPKGWFGGFIDVGVVWVGMGWYGLVCDSLSDDENRQYISNGYHLPHT